MRARLLPMLLASATASADKLKLRWDEPAHEPLLHLDLFEPRALALEHTGGERSYDLGWIRLGASGSFSQDGDTSRGVVGLFAYRTFHLSRWMHAWIGLGLTFEQVHDPHGEYQSTTFGLSLGTTFR